ncbi:CBS domain-containing protein [Candidatus Bathyarchaeota archaeon]|nr:CBS domain-containing protein [Candidatus Bathyarchaeota archaeon]MCK4702821.1 CBS domain-containing protein [Candidatus Bathyarchaeota archaeon]
MKVSDVMVRDPVMVAPDAPCGQLSKLMRDRGIGSVVVVKDGFPVGVVTERDLVHRVLAEGRDPDKCDADQVCTKPVVGISIYADVDMAVDMMNEYGIRRLVVVDEKDRVVGILTTDDIARNLRSMSEELAVKYMVLSRRKR